MDLKIWSKKDNIYILYFIDLAARFTEAAVIRSKTKDVIVDQVILGLADGPSAPNVFLADNNGEL